MKVFLSVPFTSRALPDNSLDPIYKQQMERVILGLRKNGDDVFCALEHAGWSFGGLTPPEQELQKDLDEITSSDLIIVLLEERVSAGVQLELGYAYAKNKRIDVYQIGKAAWSNIAFSRLSGNHVTQINSIEDFIENVLGSSSASPTV